MISIIKENNGLVISGKELSRFFNSDGYLNVPLNSIILVTQTKSDIVIFKSASDYVTLFQTRWDNLTIEGELVTKENIIEKFNAIANAPQGSKINAGTNITLQEETDGSITISATGELGGTVAWQDVTDKPSTFTPSAHNHVVADITDLQGKLDEKANVSDIPNLDGYATEEWVNSQGYLTEHQDISQLATKSELATKQDTLVSGTNIKTINGNSLLGSGDIVIEGGTGDVTKQYVDEQLALKVDKTAYEADKATFALKSEIPSIEGLATSEELQNGLDGKQDKGDYALKSELPDISGLATKAEVDETYAKKTEIPDISDFATKEELEAKADASALASKQDTLISGTNIKTINGQTLLGEGNIEIQGGGSGISDAPSDGKKYVRQNANWVEETTVDTSNFATKAELDGKVDDAEIADMLTKTEAASTYQPKGEYLTAIPDEYVTETELNGKGYLTEIPSEYVTETELNGKGYATTSQLDSKLDTETYNLDKATFATKAELAGKANSSDLSNYLTTSVAESTYAKESSLEELKTSKLDVSTYNQDKETFALKTEIPNDYLTDADLTDYLTKDEASDTYRQKKIINFNRTNRSTEITNAWANSLNNIGATFQYVSFDEGATYNNVLYCGYRSYDGAGNRKGVGITEIDGKMRSVIFEFSGIDCVATLEDEIDLSNYLTTTDAESNYAKKSEIPSLEGYLQTSTADEKYATKTELSGKADTSAIADMLTKTEASNTYQPKGEYLTEIPSEYITESELNAKEYKKIVYLTQTQYDELPTKEEGVMYVITDAPEVVVPDTSTFATKEEIADMLTKTEAASTYQPKGEYATTSQLATKQDTLVSGESIKTINGESILGSGDIVIEGGAPGESYIQNLNTVNADNIFGFYSIDNSGDGAKYPYKLTSRNGIKISKDSGNAAFIESDTEVLLTKTEASTTYKTIASEWFGTQSEYDLITEKDPNVTYFITEG